GTDVLVFSFLGFVTQEILIAGRSTIDVQLAESEAALDEVMIIGYGTVTRQDATGAVSQISSEDFNECPMKNAEQLIQCKVDSVSITSGVGATSERQNIVTI